MAYISLPFGTSMPLKSRSTAEQGACNKQADVCSRHGCLTVSGRSQHSVDNGRLVQRTVRELQTYLLKVHMSENLPAQLAILPAPGLD